jgi:hypothetical protein
MDIFELKPLDEETLQDLREISAERAAARRKEALGLFYTLRSDFSDAFSELGIVVLKPLCETCAGQRAIALPGFGFEEATIVAVLPGYRPEQLRMYDMTNHHLHLFPYARPDDEDGSAVSCFSCGDRVDQNNDDGDELFAVEPQSFCEYFGIEDEGPKKPDGDLREEIRELYGNLCYRCGSTKEITIDHIVPKSADGCGIPTNLQLLCRKCNEEKADTVPGKLILALDFLTRPAPWDSYEGLIW